MREIAKAQPEMYHISTQDRNSRPEDRANMNDDATGKIPDGEAESSGSGNTGDRIGMILGLVQSMGTNLEDVKGRLTTLEKTVGERLYDTKPIWERALAEIAEVRLEVTQIRTEMAGMGSDVAGLRSEMGDGLHKLGKKIELLIEDVFAVRTENRILGKQIDKLESKTS